MTSAWRASSFDCDAMSGPRYQTSPEPRVTQQRGKGGAGFVMVADKAREYYDKQAKERQKEAKRESSLVGNVENLPQLTGRTSPRCRRQGPWRQRPVLG